MPSLHPSERPPSFLKKQPGCWPRKTLGILCCPSQFTERFPTQCFLRATVVGAGGGRLQKKEALWLAVRSVLLSAASEKERLLTCFRCHRQLAVELEWEPRVPGSRRRLHQTGREKQHP